VQANQAQPRAESYDVIVVGGGLGGLSAAAALAKLGRHVLLVERHDAVGGCAHAFLRGPYTFDPAVHITCEAHVGGLLDFYLRQLGVRELVNFIELDHMYGVAIGGGDPFALPTGIDAFVEANARLFPGQAAGIRKFFELSVALTLESRQLAVRLKLDDLEAAMKQFPTLFRYRTATLQQVLDEHLDDDRAKALCGASWPYQGLPPSKQSFASWAAQTAAMLDPAPQYCEGSFQRLVDAFVAAIERNGGEIVVNSPVTRIAVEEGRVGGVVIDGGDVVRAPLVVSNADAKTTCEELVGIEHFSRGYANRLRRLKPSLSAYVLYAATRTDPAETGLAGETFLHESWDHDANHRAILEGRPGGVWMSLPTLVDPTLAPEGEHLVVVSSLAAYDPAADWERERERFREELLGAGERMLPGFRDGLTFTEMATPETLRRLIGNQGGAAYGWENTPAQCTPKRLPRVTSVEGLVLSGHWTEPGTGSFRSIVSGLQTAMVLGGYESLPAVVGALGDSAPA